MDRQPIIDFIESIDEGLHIQMSNLKMPYDRQLRGYMTEMLIYVEQQMRKVDTNNILQGFSNATTLAQAELRELQWREGEVYRRAEARAIESVSFYEDLKVPAKKRISWKKLRDSNIFLIKARERVQAYTALLSFWELMRKQFVDEQSRSNMDNEQPHSPSESNSKKPAAFANFTDKLINGFTEEDLNDLLVFVNFKDKAGSTLKFYSYLIHDIIDALALNEYFLTGNREIDQKGLQRYLGLKETRIMSTEGDSKLRQTIRNKALAFLGELKKERKKNGSF